MNDTPKRAFGASAKSKRKDVNLDLPTARNMLPLVQSIVRDIVTNREQLGKLHPEQENLERHRRDLSWLERERRYHIQDEITATEGAYKRAVTELRDLGLALVNETAARVAFPTRINGRPAVFTWQPGEDNVLFWNYEDEELRRPIPTNGCPGPAAAEEVTNPLPEITAGRPLSRPALLPRPGGNDWTPAAAYLRLRNTAR